MQLRRWIAVLLAALGGAFLLVVPALAVGGFPDAPASHPYYTAIEELAARNIIGGYANGNFGPDDPVMRQQFAKMVVKTMNLPVTGSEICPFGDVATQMGADPFYPSKYVAVCAQYNITKGRTSTEFAPYRDITRGQVVTMLVRAADNLLPGALEDPPEGWKSPHNLPLFDSHGENVEKAEYNGLLAGLQGLSASWNGYASASRGECAQLLYNLILLEGSGDTTTSTTIPGHTYTTVDVITAYQQLSANEEARLVDVREPSEWESTGIPEGALLIPLGQLEQRAPTELAEDKPVYVICHSGGRSRIASETLIRLGFTHVCNVDGGILAWIAAGLPVEPYQP